MRYAREKQIAAAPSVVFDFVTDQSKLPRWSPEVVKSEVWPAGPIERGAKIRQTRRVGRREVTSVVEVTAHEPSRRHTVKARVLGIDAVFSFTFIPSGRGTLVRLEAEVKGRGLARLWERAIARVMERSDDRLLERLSQAITS